MGRWPLEVIITRSAIILNFHEVCLKLMLKRNIATAGDIKKVYFVIQAILSQQLNEDSN